MQSYNNILFDASKFKLVRIEKDGLLRMTHATLPQHDRYHSQDRNSQIMLDDDMSFQSNLANAKSSLTKKSWMEVTEHILKGVRSYETTMEDICTPKSEPLHSTLV